MIIFVIKSQEQPNSVFLMATLIGSWQHRSSTVVTFLYPSNLGFLVMFYINLGYKDVMAVFKYKFCQPLKYKNWSTAAYNFSMIIICHNTEVRNRPIQLPCWQHCLVVATLETDNTAPEPWKMSNHGEF